jgi:DNA polymerase elongation subunit (family B)
MNVLIYDIETLKEMFLVGIYIPHEDAYHEFEVSKSKYDLDKFVDFSEKYKDFYWVGYNNLRFDIQVVEWILRKCHDWGEKSNLDVAGMIAQKAQDVIHDANYDVFAEYREEELSLKQIDLFKIHHFDNKNRRVSLKRLEFEMDLENIEEMPIHHTKVGMTLEDRKLTRQYCKNDVMATYEFYKVTIGDTNHPLYKGNDQIQLRLDIEKEFDIPCINYSDSKIGDEIIKKYYSEEKKIDIKTLPRKGKFRSHVYLSKCIAPYVQFKTVQLDQFLKKLRGMKMGMADDFKEQIHFYDNVYSFMKGGLHTENKPEVFEQDEDHLIIDWDVSSYYPAIIINNKQYPYHLGKEFLTGYKKMYEKRLELKPFAKKDKKIGGIVGALKLAVNSVYGKSSDMNSWIYDRQLTMFTTITGELSLMMLIEAYEAKEIRVISANTDGVTIYIHKSKLAEMDKINAWWCKITGYELERADYKKIIFSTVNDYLAIKTDGEIKKKGDFLTDFELHKNKSARIVPLALERYFVDGVDIAETISLHRSPYDFCIRQKSTSDFHYEGYRKGIEPSVYNKLIRYYVTSGGDGEKLLKIKNQESDSTAPSSSQVEAGDWLCKVVNYLPANTDVKSMNINYQYYIDKAESLVLKIVTKGKKRKIERIANQISLF